MAKELNETTVSMELGVRRREDYSYTRHSKCRNRRRNCCDEEAVRPSYYRLADFQSLSESTLYCHCGTKRSYSDKSEDGSEDAVANCYLLVGNATLVSNEKLLTPS